ncbi:response regulator (plasmid) [Sinorhizobium meliloti]|uniref:response regulator n=1 Tax=Sinorhizobium TaxID=28105 RepID=UPI002949463F|nr:response regulator [Sinorhizobium meliloti]WRQ71684.1 response regulator [Sinorhizobium meliloti]GCA50316.1 transcriptional regulatory protein OmpR [Sinorhizobium sp. KGO-5]
MANARTLPEHILVVDDDARIRQMLARYFEEEGYRVSLAGDGLEMRECLDKESIDIILLDLVLPGEDGLALARGIRARSDVPLIMLTGRNDVVDRVVGLEVGADDYIAKPFHLREVLARVRGVLRRRQPQQSQSDRETPSAEVYCFEGLRLDIDRRQLVADDDGREVPLTTGEFDMLCVLVKHAGRVLQRELLMDLTRGRNLEAFDRTIDAQIARLRRKIERDPTRPALIKSVRGVGYVFSARATRHRS